MACKVKVKEVYRFGVVFSLAIICSCWNSKKKKKNLLLNLWKCILTPHPCKNDGKVQLWISGTLISRHCDDGHATSCLNVGHQSLGQFSFVESDRSFLCDLPVGLSQLGELDGVVLFQDVTVAPAKHLTGAREEEGRWVNKPRLRQAFLSTITPPHQSAVSFLMVSWWLWMAFASALPRGKPFSASSMLGWNSSFHGILPCLLCANS